MKAGTTSAACVAILRRDLALTWVRRGDALNPLMFAIIVVALFPFALGPEAETLARIAAGTIFVAVLLAGLLSLDTLFRSDLEDGSLEQLVLSPHPLSLLLACKIAIHWLTTALPLIAIAPLLAQLLHLPDQVLPVLIAALALATPLLSLIGAVCVALTIGMRRSGMLLTLLVLPLIAIAPLLAQLLHLPDQVLPVLIAALALATPLLSLIGAVCVALTIGMRRSGMLLTLLVLPLIVPVLIFGAGACNAAQLSLPYGAPLLWLGAWLVMALVLAPLASATALKISLT